MYQHLGNFVSKRWPFVLVAWVAITAIIVSTAPSWESVVADGEFAFLPEDSASRQAEALFQEAFPDDMLSSSIVVVVRRVGGNGLEESDKQFITSDLVPKLHAIVESSGGFYQPNAEQEPAQAADQDGQDREKQPPIVSQIKTFNDKQIGHLLDSEDGKATLVIMELRTEFLERANHPMILEVEDLIASLKTGKGSDGMPPGLDLSISGTATAGRDLRQAADESASATELWTVILVLGLLLAIYRAPGLALIPLITVGMATNIALSVLAFLSQLGWVELFSGIEVYVTVIVYGAGVDYCLFLIARYREELDAGGTFDEAISNSLWKVGAALTASAGTVMCGIGMMMFAEFGKFQQAGVAITLGLFVVLCAALTFTPAIMRLANKWAFWPNVRNARIADQVGWISPTNAFGQLLQKISFQSIWEKTSQVLLARPGTIWLTSLAIMAPFAVIGVMFYGHLSYGLLSELPHDDPSVIGAKAVQDHFPPGAIEPVKMLISVDQDQRINFSEAASIKLIEDFTNGLREQRETFGVADVRSVSHPLGGDESLSNMGWLKRRKAHDLAVDYYVCRDETRAGSITRVDIVFQNDPFSRDSIRELENFRHQVVELLPQELRGASLSFLGATPSISDLKEVTDRDQIRIDGLVLGGVLLILVLLLKRFAVPAYLIVSVFFSYLVTLGVTFALFWMMDPSGFAGLDWKVPMFLFTILIAVGEDYNIFLMTRIEEEQVEHGAVMGVTEALQKTGSIISSCGIIMAGTFSSLLAGSLVGMHQLGFALAFGVLLDTFVVRPILVPAYLILLHSGRFGQIGKLLGACDYRLEQPRQAGIAPSFSPTRGSSNQKTR